MPDEKTPQDAAKEKPEQKDSAKGEGDGKGKETPNKPTLDELIERTTDPDTKEALTNLRTQKQSANNEAKTLREEREAFAAALGVKPEDLKADQVKAIKELAGIGENVRKALGGDGKKDEDPLKVIAELKPFQEKAMNYEAGLKALLEEAKKQIPEEFHALIPGGDDPLVTLNWITKANAAGLFGEKSAAKGTKPPASGDPKTQTLTVTDEDKKQARMRGISPEEAAETRVGAERIKAGDRPNGIQTLVTSGG